MGKLKYKKSLKMSAEDVKDFVENEKNKGKAGESFPKWIFQKYNVKNKKINGFDCYYISKEENYSGTWILYLYGSSYCYNPELKHWNLAIDIMERTKAGIIMPMYPLAPEHCCRDVFKMLMETYRMISTDTTVRKVVIMGDESGAGLSLSLSLQLWKEGLKKPDKMILISPSLDTEFFDRDMEKILIEKSEKEKEAFFSESIKEFLNIYWVKDYVGRTEFTSPIYEEFTDICDNILIISGTDGVYNAYARKFYDKAKQGGMNVTLNEYRGMKHGFIMDKSLPQTEHAKRLITDIITDSTDNIISQYMYEIKERGKWTKRFPDIFKDDIATEYLKENDITYEKYKHGENDFRMMLAASRQRAYDEGVKKFLMEYPDGTVVSLGSGMDTMFERTDNGRVLWYNCDNPVVIGIRRMYIAEKTREKTIDRAVFDYKWMDEMDCDMKKGLLFICKNNLEYLNQDEVKNFMLKISEKFPGSYVLFDVSGFRSMLMTNFFYRRREINFTRRRFYMNDPERGVSNWNSGFRVVSADSILKNIKLNNKWSGWMKLKFRYTASKENFKLVHLRLGTERYETEII